MTSNAPPRAVHAGSARFAAASGDGGRGLPVSARDRSAATPALPRAASVPKSCGTGMGIRGALQLPSVQAAFSRARHWRPTLSGVAADLSTFGEGEFASLSPRASAALAARCIQRVMPLYQRARAPGDDVHAEVELLQNALLWAQVYSEVGGYRCSYERAHDAIGRFAVNLSQNDFDDPAASIALACSELCNAIVQMSLGDTHDIRTVPNNTLRAAWLTKPGLEALLRNEVQRDKELYTAADLSASGVYSNVQFPLWSQGFPEWFLDPECVSLIHAFELEGTLPHKSIIEISRYVSDELLRALLTDPSLMFSLHHRTFEELVADVWSRFGFDVELTQHTRDGGRDIIAIQHQITPVKYLIECKRLSEGRAVAIEAVRALWYVKSRDKATKAILATTGRFASQTVKEFEPSIWELELRDFDGVMEWLNVCASPLPGSA